MKIKISNFCFQCLNEIGNDAVNYQTMIKELEKHDKVDIQVELNSENLYVIECDKGHKNNLRLQVENFEILFDLSTLALNDGYSKESFTTMFSAYERFVEYCIKIICHGKSVSKDEYLKTWKLMAKQSERQIGAFYFLQLLEFGSTKYSIPQKWIEIRNDIVHKGLIPESKKVIEFGDFLLKMIQLSLIELNLKYPESVKLVTILGLMKLDKSISESDSVSNGTIPTIINLSGIKGENYGKNTFSEALESIKTNGFYKDFYRKN